MFLRRSVLFGTIPPEIALGKSNERLHRTTAESSPDTHGLGVVHGPVLSLFLLFLASTPAHAQAPAGANRPIGVPDWYVITASGYFHPSCVRQLAEGDTLLEDVPAIRHSDGTVENVPPCKYPHYTTRGEIVRIEELGELLSPNLTLKRNWIEAGLAGIGTSYGYLTAKWTVPQAPTSNDGQIISLFPGLQSRSFSLYCHGITLFLLETLGLYTLRIAAPREMISQASQRALSTQTMKLKAIFGRLAARERHPAPRGM
jgi:hypothetical protein